MKKEIILLGLNEINFEYVERYVEKGYLKNFKILFEEHGFKRTSSENRYELLEPWIQWVSIHTGKSYDEHKVFRLGDIVHRDDLKQLWEIAEDNGYTVGAVSPFNAKNNLRHPAFFVPDPWTKTTPAGSDFVKKLSSAVSAAVNNNANNSNRKEDVLVLLRGIIRFVPFKRKLHYMKLLIAKRKAKATKAAVLDNLLADTFLSLWKEHTPGFSSLFLNSGAHEQHHYMFNCKVYNGELKNPEWYCPSEEDPVYDILNEYDIILGELMKLNCRLIIATGLHQNPHKHNTFYWRLKDHASFLNLIGITGFREVQPRMSRDFLILFDNEPDAAKCEEVLNTVTLNGERLFTIDNRNDSLFIELTYSKELTGNDFIDVGPTMTEIDLFKYVSFVAIKNGEHNGEGYYIDTARKFNKEDIVPLTDIFKDISNLLRNTN